MDSIGVVNIELDEDEAAIIVSILKFSIEMDYKQFTLGDMRSVSDFSEMQRVRYSVLCKIVTAAVSAGWIPDKSVILDSLQSIMLFIRGLKDGDNRGSSDSLSTDRSATGDER